MEQYVFFAEQPVVEMIQSVIQGKELCYALDIAAKGGIEHSFRISHIKNAVGEVAWAASFDGRYVREVNWTHMNDRIYKIDCCFN